MNLFLKNTKFSTELQSCSKAFLRRSDGSSYLCKSKFSTTFYLSIPKTLALFYATDFFFGATFVSHLILSSKAVARFISFPVFIISYLSNSSLRGTVCGTHYKIPRDFVIGITSKVFILSSRKRQSLSFTKISFITVNSCSIL